MYISGNRYFANGWDVPNLDPARYYEEKITPNASYSITVTQLSFNFQRTAASGPTNYEIRISTDNFATFTTVGAAPLPEDVVTNVSIPISTVTNLAGTLTIRVFFWGATNVVRTISLGSASIIGTVQSPPLPVELIAFQARNVGGAVHLGWTTAWERNAAHYTVQRRLAGGEFATVGTVAAAGNSTARNTYALIDQYPANGINYYRLVQTDQDGSTTYAKLVAVQVETNVPTVVAYANPADGRSIRLHLHQLESPHIQLYTLTGQNLPGVVRWQTTTEATYLPERPLAPGLYLLTAREGLFQKTLRVLIE
jgi:hypothetical protein